MNLFTFTTHFGDEQSCVAYILRNNDTKLVFFVAFVPTTSIIG